jgi:hypothetical protein
MPVCVNGSVNRQGSPIKNLSIISPALRRGRDRNELRPAITLRSESRSVAIRGAWRRLRELNGAVYEMVGHLGGELG